MAIIIRTLCWALIFTIRLRFRLVHHSQITWISTLPKQSPFQNEIRTPASAQILAWVLIRYSGNRASACVYVSYLVIVMGYFCFLLEPVHMIPLAQISRPAAQGYLRAFIQDFATRLPRWNSIISASETWTSQSRNTPISLILAFFFIIARKSLVKT